MQQQDAPDRQVDRQPIQFCGFQGRFQSGQRCAGTTDSPVVGPWIMLECCAAGIGARETAAVIVAE